MAFPPYEAVMVKRPAFSGVYTHPDTTRSTGTFWQLAIGAGGALFNEAEKLTVPPEPFALSTAVAKKGIPTDAGLGKIATERCMTYFTYRVKSWTAGGTTPLEAVIWIG